MLNIIKFFNVNIVNIVQRIRKKMMQHKSIAIFLMIITFICIDLVSFKINQHSSIFVQLVKKYYFVPVLSEAENFYKTYDEPLQTDEFVMLLWLWPERAYSLERVFEIDPFYRMYSNKWKIDNLSLVRRADSREEVAGLAKIFGINTMLYEITDEKIGKIMTDPTDDIVLKALYCDESGYDDFDYKLLSVIRDDEGGYGDTHYLLSLLFLERLGCGNTDVVMQDKQDVIGNILAAESEEQEFSDLFVERIALLYWAGHGQSVDIEWINKVAKNIQRDGGWRDVGVDKSDPHTTGLAALAIKYFISDVQDGQILIR